MDCNGIAEGVNKYGVGTYAISIFFALFITLVLGLGKISYDTMIDNRETNKQLIATNTNLVESNRELVNISEKLAESNAETVKQISTMADNMKTMNYKLDNISNTLGLKAVTNSKGEIIGYTPVRMSN